jgi:16S rRNA (cytidine1402-2'-O)-methyltransferase
MAMIRNGKSISLISDAGTPGISDPGFLLVRECIRAGIPVSTLPGPTAFVPALVNSGFPCNEFSFYGFLPQKKGRATALKELKEETKTFVLYESPFRLLKLLAELHECFGNSRMVCVCRELSKKFEETKRATAAELINHYTANPPKGEIVVVVEQLNTAKKKENDTAQ